MVDAPPSEPRKDFFVSYTGQDQQWAEWIAFQLEHAGYTTVIQAWDFKPGENFVELMHQASSTSTCTIGVVSEAYLSRAAPSSEWTAAVAAGLHGQPHAFIPVRIQDFRIPGLLAPVIYIDLAGKDEKAALKALLDGIRQSMGKHRPKPAISPNFPGAALTIANRMPFPGAVVGTPPRPRRFVHSRVAAEDWLQVALVGDPYTVARDPTDDAAAPRSQDALHAFVWTPPTDYFRDSAIEAFTPVVMVCTLSPSTIDEHLRGMLERQVFERLSLAPRTHFREHRAAIYPAIGRSLKDSFATAITLPRSLFIGSSAHPQIAYQTIANLVLAPLLDMHRTLRIVEMHISLAEVGAANPHLMAPCKRLAKAILGTSRIRNSVVLGASDPASATVLQVCRHLAWAVGQHHNHVDKDRWIEKVEQAIDVDVDPARLEESTPE